MARSVVQRRSEPCYPNLRSACLGLLLSPLPAAALAALMGLTALARRRRDPTSPLPVPCARLP